MVILEMSDWFVISALMYIVFARIILRAIKVSDINNKYLQILGLKYKIYIVYIKKSVLVKVYLNNNGTDIIKISNFFRVDLFISTGKIFSLFYTCLFQITKYNYFSMYLYTHPWAHIHFLSHLVRRYLMPLSKRKD